MLISVFVVSDHTCSERKIDLEWTVSDLKARLYPVTGIEADDQKITVLDSADRPDQLPSSPQTQLKELPFLTPFCRIHVKDDRPGGQVVDFNDLSKVQKFEISEDQYESRPNTVLHWKKANNLGRFDPNAKLVLDQNAQRSLKEIETRKISVGKRCKVSGGRLGTIMSVGLVPEIASKDGQPSRLQWVGVRFDEPSGKNDGSIQGKRYFECLPNFGSFIKPEMVEVGDFEPQDIDEL